MTKSDLLKTGSALAQEILSALHLPGTVALSRATDAALQKRFNEGVTALIAELEQAGREGMVFGKEDHDVFVQMLCRFSDALRKGSATRNLRMLARILVGLKADGSFHYDEFGRWSGVVEDLTLDELHLLVCMHRCSQTIGLSKGDLWHAIKQEQGALEGDKEYDLIGRMMALSRTGLVCSLSGYGSLIFVPTSSLARLVHLSGLFEDV